MELLRLLVERFTVFICRIWRRCKMNVSPGSVFGFDHDIIHFHWFPVSSPWTENKMQFRWITVSIGWTMNMMYLSSRWWAMIGDRDKDSVITSCSFPFWGADEQMSGGNWLKISSPRTSDDEGRWSASKFSIREMRSRKSGVKRLDAIRPRMSVIGCLFAMREIGSVPNGWIPFEAAKTNRHPRLKTSNDGWNGSCWSVGHIHPSVVTRRNCVSPVASSRTAWRMPKSANLIIGSVPSPFGKEMRILDGFKLAWTIPSACSWFNPDMIW